MLVFPTVWEGMSQCLGTAFPTGREYWILRSNGFGRRLFVLFLNLVDGSKDLFLIAVDSISQNNERKGFGYML